MRLISSLLSITIPIFTAALPQKQVDPNVDDYKCLSSFHKYDTSSAQWSSSTLTTIKTQIVYSTSIDSNVPYTTLCDGRTRALEPFRYSPYPETYIHEPPLTSPVYFDYPGALPTCTIAETACTPIRSAWTSSYSDYVSNGAPYPTGQPHCTTRIGCDTRTNSGQCYLYGGNRAKLYFWPVTTRGGDFCAQNGTTVTPTPTNPNGAPNTGVVDGITFTSPTNYISLEYLDASVHFRRPPKSPCGPEPRTNVLVPLTGQFSSTRGYEGGGFEHSFNFADLATPVPASAWDGQSDCNSYAQTGACLTILGRYVPQVMIPTQVINLEPQWVSAGCVGTMTPLQIHTYVNLENGRAVLPPESQITHPPEIGFATGENPSFQLVISLELKITGPHD